MKQIESFSIANPCQRICRFNRQRYCRTCLRHMEERIAWEQYSDEEKRAVLRKCYRRKLAYRRAAYLQQQAAKRQKNISPLQQLSLFDSNEERSHHKSENTIQKISHDDNPQIPLL